MDGLLPLVTDRHSDCYTGLAMGRTVTDRHSDCYAGLALGRTVADRHSDYYTGLALGFLSLSHFVSQIFLGESKSHFGSNGATFDKCY